MKKILFIILVLFGTNFFVSGQKFKNKEIFQKEKIKIEGNYLNRDTRGWVFLILPFVGVFIFSSTVLTKKEEK